MDNNEITTLLKQYETLRAEILEKVKIHSGMNLTLVLAVVAALVGAKGEMSLSLIAFFVPAVALFAMFVSRVGWRDMEESSRQIARIEDKLYLRFGYPLIAHEAELVFIRSTDCRHEFLVRDVGATIIYIAVELLLFFKVDPNISRFTFGTPVRRFLIFLVLAIPPVLLLSTTVTLARRRRNVPSFAIFDAIRQYQSAAAVSGLDDQFRTFDYAVEKNLSPAPTTSGGLGLPESSGTVPQS